MHNVYDGVYLGVEKDGVEEQGQDNPNDVSPPIASVERAVAKKRTFSDLAPSATKRRRHISTSSKCHRHSST